ncbi:sugar ABC transporter substrate-binding protein [Arcanobacterium phocae]|uniref:sugar ABC transporter substrate-binding protein n=1 Tax=Arcanobacterium phocae TaxID=131112 RepID=UPI001C0EDBDA|nr:maltose ABC transporter substrate-binding protein [Arcanobacterium phocae]
MKRTLMKIGAVAAASLLLCGACSTANSQKSDGKQDKNTSAVEDKEEDLARTNADLVIWCDNDRAPIVKKYADEFAKKNGITAAVQVSGDVRTQFATATKVGKGPDIVVGAHDWLGSFVQNGMVRPLNLSDETISKFSKTAIDGARFEGKVYGLPYAIENIALIRNKTLAPNAPETMDELVAVGKELVDSGKADRTLVQEVSKSGNAYYAYPYLSGFGGGIFAANDQGEFDPNNVIIDSEESLKGAQLLAKLGSEGVLSTNISGENADSLFATGKVPFQISGPWAVESAKKAGIDYEITPLPRVADSGRMLPFVGVQLFYVSAHANNPSIAEEFVLDTLTREDLQIELFNIGHRPPALTSAFDKVSASDKDIAAWFAASEGALPMPNIPAMNSVWGPFGQAEADVISGTADPVERFKAAADEIRKVLRESK